MVVKDFQIDVSSWKNWECNCEETPCICPFGFDICGECKTKIKREKPLAVRCPSCGEFIRCVNW